MRPLPTSLKHLRPGRLLLVISVVLLSAAPLGKYSWDQSAEPGGATIGSSEISAAAEIPSTAPAATVSRQVDQHSTLQPLVDCLDSGRALKFTADGLATQHLLLEPVDVFAPDFQLTLGKDRSNRIDSEAKAYRGRAFQNGAGEASAAATMAIVGNALHLELEAPGGSHLTVVGTATEGFRATMSVGNPHAGAECQLDIDAGVARYQGPSRGQRIDGVNVMAQRESQDEGNGVAAKLDPIPDVLHLSGVDPATGKLDKFVDPIPLGAEYMKSLRDALVLLVLDKRATGSSTRGNLHAKASQSIARIANVAAVYENQLGVRLLLQELVLIPRENTYADVSSIDALGDFEDWCGKNRSQRNYGWSMAVKQGAGLPRGTLGIANLARLQIRAAVSVVDSEADYSVIAHEMAHNLGSGHAHGGIMNERSIPDHGRNFFADVMDREGETAAKVIYNFTRNRLSGAQPMRHAEEMPFAVADTARTKMGVPVAIRVLANDRQHVRHGKTNSVLRVAETGRVVPASAGTAHVTVDGNSVEFVPTQDFVGTAWFSYTLRGNVGNDDQGWLHKGDVAVEVEGADARPQVIRLQPGSSFSFFPQGGSRDLTQPEQAHAIRHEDDSTLVVLRVNADATGSDQFRAGGATYSMSYGEPGPVVVPDEVWVDEFRESVMIAPLANDTGVGFPWLHQIDPFLGVDSAALGAVVGARHFFPTSFLLADVENLHPDLGSVKMETLMVSVEGRATRVPTGRLLYKPAKGVTGMATLRYGVRDASGHEAKGLITIQIGTGHDTLVGPTSAASIAVPTEENAPVFDDWMRLRFAETREHWTPGNLGVGFDTWSGYQDWIQSNVEEALHGKGVGAYVRIPFEVSPVAEYSKLGLRARYDDGFVAYLNGQRVASKNAPPDVDWDTAATATHEHGADEPFGVFDLSHRRDLLVPGTNVLAIHVMNDEEDSSDLLFQPALVAYPEAPESPAVPGNPAWFDPFVAWRNQFGINLDAAAPDVAQWDTDLDGFSDLVEFAVNSSPNDESLRPSLELTIANAGVRVTATLRYLRLRAANDIGIRYVLEQAGTLRPNVANSWATLDLEALLEQGASITITEGDDPDYEIVKLWLAHDLSETPSLYYRLRVEVN
jgi:hypothetical protein